MTKKHFEALAEVLKMQNPGNPRNAGVTQPATQWVTDVYSVMAVCEHFNPRFDRARFLKACGVEQL